MFNFAICLILIFLFDETFSKSTEIQHQNSPQFWHDFMQENGIWDEQIKQMADEMDESDPFIEKLSNEENYPPQSSEHPAFEKTYSYKFNHNSTPNELKHPGKQSLFFKLLKFGNFYELVGRLGKMAKLVQNLAKTFINIKSSLLKKGQIKITMGQTENAVKLLAKQNEIDYEKAGKSTGMQIELPEIVKRMATIWSEMSNAKNGGENSKEIVQKVVNLWHLAKQNDEFKKYFGNNKMQIIEYFRNKMTQKDKNEGKNRRSKRIAIIFIAVAGVLVAFVCFLIFVMVVFKNLSD